MTQAHRRVLLVLALYAAYLPFSGYEPVHIFYDAGEHWELSTRFFQHKHFDFLGFNGLGRGYLGPLLLLPGWLLCRLTECSSLTATRALGACWAALLYGAVLPCAWRQASGQALSAGRWLVLIALGFALWRDYFNFPLTDFPGFTLLLLGLLALARPQPVWWLGAGMALAAALNLRPFYVAALPAWLVVTALLSKKEGQPWPVPGYSTGEPARLPSADTAAGPRARRQGTPGRWLALFIGAALVVGPQALLNWRHERLATPLVLVSQNNPHRDYLHTLAWGTRLQRYETGFFPEGHRVLMVLDPAGIRQLAPWGAGGFASYREYAAYVARYPGSVARRYARHLFNGLDLWFPTPYARQVHPPSQPALQGLNFAALGLGLGHLIVIARRRARAKIRMASGLELAVGAALLLPVLAALPGQVEPRYFLALHMLLLLLAVTARPLRWAGLWPSVRPRRLIQALLLATVWLVGCWWISHTTQRLEEFDRFDLMQ